MLWCYTGGAGMLSGASPCAGSLRGLVRQLSIDQFENESRRVSCDSSKAYASNTPGSGGTPMFEPSGAVTGRRCGEGAQLTAARVPAYALRTAHRSLGASLCPTTSFAECSCACVSPRACEPVWCISRETECSRTRTNMHSRRAHVRQAQGTCVLLHYRWAHVPLAWGSALRSLAPPYRPTSPC